MFRRLRAILPAISLLLCAAACILWWESYPQNLWDIQVIGNRRYSLASSDGMVFFDVRTKSLVPEYHMIAILTRLAASPPTDPLGDDGFVRRIVAVRFQFHYREAPRLAPLNEFAGFGFWKFDALAGPYDDKSNPSGLDAYWLITAHILTIPYWFIVMLLLLLPVARLRRWDKARVRRLANQCVQCGYDLRATPQRCPECGKAAIAKTTP
jgi:hypothetical protein